MTTDLQPAEDLAPFAVAGFLARYREPTLSAYRRDLRCFWVWCLERDLPPLSARRPHIELHAGLAMRRDSRPCKRAANTPRLGAAN